MSDEDPVLFDGCIAIPAPLSMRIWQCPSGTLRRVLIDGPPGVVELQIRPGATDDITWKMSLEFHSRQATSGSDTALPNCDVLGGVACYADGFAFGSQDRLQIWFLARNGQAIVDELVDLHHSKWPPGNDDTADEQHVKSTTLTAEHIAAARLRLPRDERFGRRTSEAIQRIAQLPAAEVPPWD
ncbi:MAG TPA: hypothetical protein VFG15_03090 [Amycolatopsis sp.]|nr:hypothetical protein [Amycolatopsis sp.]